MKVRLTICVEVGGPGAAGSRAVPSSVPVPWLEDLLPSFFPGRKRRGLAVPWAGRMLERDIGVLYLFSLAVGGVPSLAFCCSVS